jgi:hypothetical protein
VDYCWNLRAPQAVCNSTFFPPAGQLCNGGGLHSDLSVATVCQRRAMRRVDGGLMQSGSTHELYW